jgi:hypothetical protein
MEDSMESGKPKTMTDDEATTFLDDLRQHAERSAMTHFTAFENDDEQLARGPQLNEGFNDFLREKGMNWMHFERDEKQFANYCSHEYVWVEGYAYRKLLVRRYRETLE